MRMCDGRIAISKLAIHAPCELVPHEGALKRLILVRRGKMKKIIFRDAVGLPEWRISQWKGLFH